MLVNEGEYDIHADVEDRHWWWRARREILERVISRFRPASTDALRIAEIGCGSGGNLPMLARFGTVLGAEKEERAIAFLHQKRGDRFEVVRHAIPEALPGRFHVIGMFDVLEHLRDDAGALRWVAGHLEPDGIVVITVPAFRFLWTGQDEVAQHFRRYTPAGLLAVLPPELEVLHLTCFNSLLFAPIAAVRAVMNVAALGSKRPRSHLGIPPEPINSVFFRIFRLERHFVPRARLPFGVSALLVARRKSRSA